MIINQWVPAAHKGDAIGDSARRVRTLLREKGCQSDLFALTMDDDLRDDVRPFDDPASRRGDVTIFHFALPSPMTGAFAQLPGARVLQYHNITPAHFFAGYDAGMCRLATFGRQELATLVGHVDLALGDSEFNRQELDDLGFAPTGVMPIAIDIERLTRAPRRPALEKLLLDDGQINILFVGRVAPNKKIDDYVRLAELYKRYIDQHYRFLFVGKYDAVPAYYAAVQGLRREFKIPTDRMIFTGPVPNEDLAAYYRCADVYVSLSEHEGFCVPLLEAMAVDVPVLAYGAGAVPETMGGAGVVFTPKDLEFAAEWLGVLAYDEGTRRPIIEGQRARLQAFGDARIARELDRLIEEFS
jgi:glycosyltransferase involved in cell wall biosynthesis